MHKILTTLLGLGLITSSVVFGQVSKLELVNPGPRIGDKIEVKISFQKNNLDYLDAKTEKTEEDYELISNNQIGTGELIMTQVVSDTGWVSLGPLKFSIDDTEYVTDNIKVRVYAALPSTVKDGLWVRIITHDGEDFLIIEQRISNKWTRKQTAHNEVTMTLGESGVTYFEFDEANFEKNGIEIIDSNLQTYSQVVDKSDVLGGGTVSFKQAVYRFKRTKDFVKSFKVDRKLFKVYPETGYTEIVSVE